MDRSLLITGGGRGIGAATARLAAERGYSVCVNYRQNSERANAVVREIERDGGRAISVAADISLEQEVLRLFAICDAELGTPTALVNNAAVLETHMRVDQMDAARLHRVLATNVRRVRALVGSLHSRWERWE